MTRNAGTSGTGHLSPTNDQPSVLQHKPTRLKRQMMKIANWNIHSLKKKILTVTDDLESYNIDIAILTETWMPAFNAVWPSAGGMQFNAYNSGDSSRRQGVAIVVNSKYNDFITEHACISPRLIRLRLQQGKKAVTIIGAYAPISSAPPAEIGAFFADLQRQIDIVPANDFLILAGDFNARVGDNIESWHTVIGRWGESNQNDAGRSLLAFMANNSLRVMNTFYRHCAVRKYTFPSARSLIDLIATKSEDHIYFHNVRTRRGTATSSDHTMVVGVLVHPLKAKRPNFHQHAKQNQPSIKLERLHDDAVKHEYQTLITAASVATSDDFGAKSVEESWKDFKTAFTDAAAQSCGMRQSKQQRRTGAAWTPEMKEAVSNKRVIKRELLCASAIDKPTLRERLKEACQAVRSAARNHHHQYWSRASAKLKSNYHENVKCFWRMLKKWRKPDDNSLKLPIKREDGTVLDRPAEIRRRWQEYFTALLNPTTLPTTSSDAETSTFADDYTETRNFPVEYAATSNFRHTHSLHNISDAEFHDAISRIKMGKSAGVDGITPEMTKFAGPAGLDWLRRICEKCMESQTVPSDWQKSIVVPIFKKGDRQVCSNYRGISLLSVPGKVYAYVLERRLRNITERLLHQAQVGFRSGRGCHDGMFSLREVFERRLEYNHVTHAAFIDLEKAFDSIPREMMWKVLCFFTVPPVLTNCIKSFYADAQSAVRTEYGLTDWFEVGCGVRQGCVLSPLLFILYMDRIITYVHSYPPPSAPSDILPLSMVAYADDLAVLAASEAGLQWLVDVLSTACQLYGLHINEGKTVTMVVQRKNSSATHGIVLNGTTLARVSSFKYLGNLLTDSNDADTLIRARIDAATAEVGALGRKFFDSPVIDECVKLCVLKQVIRPTLTYGCESWPVTAKRAEQIDAAEMRAVRLISGFSRKDQWDLHITNTDILDSLELEPVSAYVEQQQLRWLGHIMRMPADSPAKTCFDYRMPLQTSRARGRPLFRWRDGAVQAFKRRTGMDLGAEEQIWTHLETLASDRSAWQRLSA